IAWLYKDPDSRLRKLGVCVELRLQATTRIGPRYVIDFEPRQPRRNPWSEATQETRNGFLVVWFDEDLELDETLAALQKVIDAVAQ
ncbi:hypothetical protein ACS2UT_27030, partial [Bacillus cereus group sp. BC311]|uniref:hypothetical protein n=1 Tax=Bacillus cereus group sp. BC311 TaxID=3445316 RepID=UPI003F25FB00